MHARMLLPGFFSIFSIIWISRPISRRSVYPLLNAGVIVWATVCLVTLRYTTPGMGGNYVANERQFYINLTGSAFPISPNDFPKFSWYSASVALRHTASLLKERKQAMTVDETGSSGPFVLYPVVTKLPERLFASFGNIGFQGLAAGDTVYVFDTFSLANPIGAHSTLSTRRRPGHEKSTDQVWMFARFFNGPSQDLPEVIPHQGLNDARDALKCQPLAGYLASITGPLSWRGVLTNFEHAFTWTTMTFSDNPGIARHQLCGTNALRG